MKLYKHQIDIISEDKDKVGIFLGCGTGKTLTTLHLAKGNTLVICPKTTKEDRTWERNLEMIDKHDITLTVISKETFRRDHKLLPLCDTLILDEVHTQAGVNPTICYKNKRPTPKVSQIFEAIQEYLERVKPSRIYPVTATPTRAPMCVLGIAWMLGKDWDFYKFRDIYYREVRMGNRNIWMVNKGMKERLGQVVQKLGYTGRMADFTDVPKQTFVVKNVGLTTQQEKALKDIVIDYPDPLVLVGKKHQIEQGVLVGNSFQESQVFDNNKLEAIQDLVDEYPKVLIFAKYTEQIFLIEKFLKDQGIQTFTLTGATKDRGTLLKEAENSQRCVVIAQASISSGYELPSFRCTIYASQDYSFVNKEQSEWRTLRMNALDKNLYVYLLSGKVDNGVYKALQDKGDFHEAIFSKQI